MSNNLFKLFLLGILFTSTIAPRANADCKGEVVEVLDGNTITLNCYGKIKIWLDGIDAPEMTQPCGRESQFFVSSMTLNKTVDLIEKGKDKYGRTLGVVLLPDGKILNREIVRAGYAWHYKEYSKDKTLSDLEKEAREKKIGLWVDATPVAPWDFRHKRISAYQFPAKTNLHEISTDPKYNALSDTEKHGVASRFFTEIITNDTDYISLSDSEKQGVKARFQLKTGVNMAWTVDEFVNRIKLKYPEYADMDNKTLADKVLAKYPEYKDDVVPTQGLLSKIEFAEYQTLLSLKSLTDPQMARLEELDRKSLGATPVEEDFGFVPLPNKQIQKTKNTETPFDPDAYLAEKDAFTPAPYKKPLPKIGPTTFFGFSASTPSRHPHYSGSAVSSDRDSYEIEVAHDDELFIINGEKFEAQTYCLGWEEGDEVLFLEGSPFGACASAELLNLRTHEKCNVWCE